MNGSINSIWVLSFALIPYGIYLLHMYRIRSLAHCLTNNILNNIIFHNKKNIEGISRRDLFFIRHQSMFLRERRGASQHIYIFIGDSLTYHSGWRFSTEDRDYDGLSINCSGKYQAGWWYNACYWSNLNGLFNIRGEYGMSWYYLDNDYGTIIRSKMMIRRK